MPEEKQVEGTYSADRPIGARSEDRFDRWPFAERIARTIAERADASSLVIGIYGVWGDGKTSVLNLMADALRNFPDTIVVTFNPWYFRSQAELLRGFFDTLADELDRSITTTTEKIGGILKKYGSILSLASIGVAGGAIQISPGAAAQGLGEQLSTANLAELRTRLETILREENKKVVVLIDDIDRLDRDEIHAIFKLVKLSAGFERTTYVLAFDDEIAAKSLGEKYGSGDVEAGRSFLEKIVQVPLHLPPADQLPLRQYCFEGVDLALRSASIELTQINVATFIRYFIDGLEAAMGTPRQARRYANALLFSLPLLRGEAHPVDQMLIEGVRIFYPRLYAVVRDNPDLFLVSSSTQRRGDDAKNLINEKLDGALAGLDQQQNDGVRKLLMQLFPQLQAIYRNTFYSSAEWGTRWDQEQRICSANYFRRYFAYTVPSGDISDQGVATLLESLCSTPAEELESMIRGYAQRGSGGRLIEKLRQGEEALDAPSAAILARAIARSADALPNEEGWMPFTSAYGQASILVSKLVERAPKGAQREDLALELMREASPIGFACDCFRWLRGDPKEPEEKRAVSVEGERAIGAALAERIRTLSEGEALYVALPEVSRFLLWTWKEYGKPGEAEEYLRGRFAADGNEVVAFLLSFGSKGWSMETGIPVGSQLWREAYDAIAGLIDPEVVFEALANTFGADIGTREFFSDHLPPAVRLANQFCLIHRQVKDSAAGKEEAAENTVTAAAEEKINPS